MGYDRSPLETWSDAERLVFENDTLEELICSLAWCEFEFCAYDKEDESEEWLERYKDNPSCKEFAKKVLELWEKKNEDVK
jgi:hypothetical protein